MALRSLVFNVLFYVLMFTTLLVFSPALLFGRAAAMAVVTRYARFAMAMHRVITGIRHEFRGLERLPETGCLVAMKHQSTWETIALVPRFHLPAFVLKKELMSVPLFGWWARRSGMIPVDRDGGTEALLAMTEQAKAAVAEGRPVLIFPEGTRREAGAPPDYKLGVIQLYKELGVPLVPVALNSGLFWPRHSLTHRKGTIVAEVLPAIPPGLEPRKAFRRMRDEIEAACDRLLLEAAAAGSDLTPLAQERVAALRETAAEAR